MTDRERKLLRALEQMTQQFPHFYDQEIASRLLSDRSLPDREKKLTAALAEMVNQCLGSDYDVGPPRFSYGAPAASAAAGADAVIALANLGLIEIHSPLSRSSDPTDDDEVVIGFGERILLMSDSEATIARLAGLECADLCLAEWTEAGKTFFAENMAEWDAWQEDIIAEADRKRRIASKFINWTDHVALAAAVAVLGLLYGLGKMFLYSR